MDVDSFPDHILDEIADRVVDRLMAIFAESEERLGPADVPRSNGRPDVVDSTLSPEEINSRAVESFAKAHPELDRNNPVAILDAYFAERHFRRTGRQPATASYRGY